MPAWNNARMWATGKPQPLAWLPGWPKWACSAASVGHGERRAVDQEDAMAATRDPAISVAGDQ